MWIVRQIVVTLGIFLISYSKRAHLKSDRLSKIVKIEIESV